MWNGLWKLTWLEIKIFRREPLGVFGSVVIPVLAFIVLGRVLGRDLTSSSVPAARYLRAELPVLVSILIVISTVLSLVTIISIYREGGILKRLRATPLRAVTILTAHVLVKLIVTAVAMALMILAGKRYYPVDIHPPVASFTLALLIASWSVLSLGFVIASIVPTARFAQPIGALILYPMLGLCGLFVPVRALPPVLQAVARVTPLTYAVSLLRGAWNGEPWLAHLGDVGALVAVFVVCTGVSARVFRWE